MNETEDREARFKLGNEAKERFKEYLKEKGYIIIDSGMENWIPDFFHKIIRSIHNNKTIDFVRYFPDLILLNKSKTNIALIEVKATSKKYREGENFAIETASLRNMQMLEEMGINVLIVFENKPYEFYMAKPSDIKVFKSYTINEIRNIRLLYGKNGSGTPMSLIKKKSIRRLILD